MHIKGPNVLHNLSCRYESNEIYTSISKVLIAINPYQQLDSLYSGSVIEQYRAVAKRKRQTLPPHVFSVSQRALRLMQSTGINQSMIVCGESGSGKTESAKHLMRYLAYRDTSKDQDADSESKDSNSNDSSSGVERNISLEEQVLDANPILESFGNAKTILNNNSSRYVH